VALSTCKAKYMAMREAIKEVIYLTNMLQWLNQALNLGLELKQKVTPLLTDSDSAMKLAENPEFHKRSKHIDITYHFIRECIRDKKVTVAFVKSAEQLADSLTKGLNAAKHQALLEGFNLKATSEEPMSERVKKVRFSKA